VTRNEELNLVTELLPRFPPDRRFRGPLVSIRVYRGKRQYVVGYEWVRPYSNYYSGLVHDCVLGWGETFEAAVDRMKKKIASQHLKELDASRTTERSGSKE
jgi:hypothetical protein